MVSGKTVMRVGLVLGLALAMVACNSDDESEGTSGAGGTAGTESGGTGGTAGDDGGVSGTSGGMGGTTGGMGGTTGGAGGMTGGTGGTAGTGNQGQSVTCGSNTCTVNPLATMFGIAPCCAADDKCGGFGGQCHALDQEGVIGDECPAGKSADGQFDLSGCCKPDGRCGLDYGAVGWGCVAREDITQYMAGETPLEAVSCGGGDEDAGM